MAFWNDTNLDPKRTYKFLVKFGTADRVGNRNVPTFLAQKADRPVYTISDSAKIDFLEKSFFFPGKVSWNTVKIDFVDGATEGTNVAKASYDYLTNAGYIAAPAVYTGGGAGSFGTPNKEAATAGLSVIVEGIDSTGAVIDTWTLRNAWVKTVALNGYDYTAENIMTAQYEFRYDWAELGTSTVAGGPKPQ